MPLLAQVVEVGVGFVHPFGETGLEFIPAVDGHVEGHAHRQVALHGGIEGDQGTLIGPVQRCAVADYPVPA